MKIKEITLRESYKVTQTSPQGLELTAQDGTKMILPPEKAAAIQADPANPNKFTMNPDAMATPDGTQPQQPVGPTMGAEVELPMGIQTTETQEEDDMMSSGINHDIGGDPTDQFINDVTDHNFGKSDRHHKHHVRESAELDAMLVIAGLR
jgi:hypothetical protein